MNRDLAVDVGQRVRQFIAENFYIREAMAIADETSLIATGYVDSTGMLEVISFLEEHYGISIADTEMTPANLETIGRIVRFVAGKQEKAPA
jgi:acyl carrier protein